jgi:hypothetical protein
MCLKEHLQFFNTVVTVWSKILFSDTFYSVTAVWGLISVLLAIGHNTNTNIALMTEHQTPYRMTQAVYDRHASHQCSFTFENFQILYENLCFWITLVTIYYSDWLRAGRSGDRIPVGARFFAHVQTGPGAHLASCTMGTGTFPGVKRPRRGADHPLPPSAEVENE